MKSEKIITYDLKSGQNSSDMFYEVLSDLTTGIYEQSIAKIDWLITRYIDHLTQKEHKDIRSKEEYLFELLSIGVYWINYKDKAMASSRFGTNLMHRLYQIRRKVKPVKKEIDYVRGILSPGLLMKFDKSDNTSLNNTTFHKLICWLEATGEFREESKRLRYWHCFFSFFPGLSSLAYTLIICEANNFIEESARVLSPYTKNVEAYLELSAPEKRGEEDYIFCSRKISDYHLSMVGAELMNIAFRDKFSNTARKALLLPACMRRIPENCKAKKESLDSTCTHCDNNCAINKYDMLGKKLGFEVHIIPHSSDFSKWLETWASGNDIGVIGVACILNLITGGLEMRDLNVPAQCIFLDYCGCRAHWDAEGIPTELNEKQLRVILGKESQSARMAV